MTKILILLLLFTNIVFAKIGNVTLIDGEVLLTRDNKTTKLSLDDEIEKNDFIETKTNSKVRITFIDDTVISIGKESNLTIDEYIFSQNKDEVSSEFSVTKGTFHTISGQIGKVNPDKFKLKTKNATMGIRGTEFLGDQDYIICTKGAIYVESFGEIIEVANGNFVSVFENQKPSNAQKTSVELLNKLNSSLGNDSSSETSNDVSSSAINMNTTNQNQTTLIEDNENSWGYWASFASSNANENSNYNTTKEQIIKSQNQNSNSGNSSNQSAVVSSVSQLASKFSESLIFNINYAGKFYENGVENQSAIANSINLSLSVGGNTNTFTGAYNYNNDDNININGNLNGAITYDLLNNGNGTLRMQDNTIDFQAFYESNSLVHLNGIMNIQDSNNANVTLDIKTTYAP